MILGAAKAALFLCRGRVAVRGGEKAILYGAFRNADSLLGLFIACLQCMVAACKEKSVLLAFLLLYSHFSISFYNTFLKYVLHVKKIIFFSLFPM